ncbi:hypothetical protein, conserved [Entamoeba dispar SAW760]|uniref:Leucine rich repeat containing protein BspA family protein n=1 Tax=Entamoeba dispar (strain ATCC PRA-260 / SAW760) TaxID=370354 RepID=B0ELH6_ENTDS|nr:uncharacterized protein EDI_173110 [Entamoeba dispar SAW760]EDR24622.1 hypothetical protein, conserved [Entamoeba dispar SAW760]|eukprot:EDR24622.1 hypothetical protein, conserved [Entamoeba dispar SAW760]
MIKKGMKLGHNEIMIVSKYFDSINDFINLEIGIKRFQGNIERFHFNPIPLNEHSRKLFSNIETFHIYDRKDKIFEDGKINKKVIWYKLKYSTYLEEKQKGNICENIAYTKSDMMKYKNKIPSEVKSLDEFKSLTSITIPTTITKIECCCFLACDSLRNMNIDNLQFVSKERIFMNEPTLISIKIPESLQTINGKEVQKKDINEFIIPTTITKLGNECFSGCSSLTTITIPTTIIEIGSSCFNECISLISINIPSLINTIADSCFYECMSLTNIMLPSLVTKLGWNSFERCTSLKEINIPSLVSEIGMHCFSDCISLTSVNIPALVSKLPCYCF